ncbi:uncharacterized protein LOC142241370 [Haematobia irritans]|uniref:uncharacterized protein LOC142241370 n=1 Tax=Haematobia irritans TaxID=7368 RepID=UPI003F4FCFEC
MAQTTVATTTTTTTTASTSTGPSNVASRNTLEPKAPEIPKNVGHLLKEPVEIDCPACRKHNKTRVDKFAVTFCQKLAVFINACCCCCKGPIKWEGRYDYNHYCSQCGCYIGRYISLNWGQRHMMRRQRMSMEVNNFFDDVVKDTEKMINELPCDPATTTTTPPAVTNGQK